MNWFEGGRRIVSIIAALIFLGGLGYLFLGGGDNRVILETSSPDERLHWTLKRCAYPALDKEWDGASTFASGATRQMVACFRAKPNGKINYGFGPERLIAMPAAANGKLPPSLKVREILEGDWLSDEVASYANARMRKFYLLPSESEQIGSGLWKIGLYRFCERAVELFPWLAGAILALWLAAWGIGWLLRGFAGIPAGHDFKTADQNKSARSNRASLEWMSAGIGGFGATAAVAWLVLKLMAPASPATTAMGRFTSKALGSVGMIVLVSIAFAVACVGAVAFKALFYRVFPSRAPEQNASEKDGVLIAFGFANLGIAMAVVWLLTTFTFVGGWAAGLDRWSRANGFQDSVTVGCFVLCLLWPLIPLALMNRSTKSAQI